MEEPINPNTDDFDFRLQQIDEAAKVESAQIEKYKQIYSQTNGQEPQPPAEERFVEERFKEEVFNPKQYSFLQEKGVDAVAFILSAIGGGVFAAIRTAGIFVGLEIALLSEYGLNSGTVSTLAWIAGLCILLAVEGYLAGYGYHKGRNSGRVNTTYWGAIIAGSISALAGVISSKGLLLTNDTAINNPYATEIGIAYGIVGFLLTLLSGPGMAYLVYLGTENVGVLHNSWLAFLQEKADEFRKEQERRFAEFQQRQTQRWDEFQQRQKQLWDDYERRLTEWRTGLEEDYRKKGREVLFGAGTYTVKRDGSRAPRKQENDQRRPNLRAEVKNWLVAQAVRPSQVGDLKDGAVVTPAHIADELKLDDLRERNAVRTYMAQFRKEEEAGKWI